MRKVLYSIIICTYACVCACNGGIRNTEPDMPQYALASLMDSCMGVAPVTNDVARSMIADTLKSKFQRYQGKHLPYIDDLFFTYEMCLEYPKTFDSVDDANVGKYVVKFSLSNGKIADGCSTTFQIFAIMNKDAVAPLVEGGTYHLDGLFRDFANSSKETGFVLPSGKCINAYPSVTTDSDGTPCINLGTLVIDSLTTSKVELQ